MSPTDVSTTFKVPNSIAKLRIAVALFSPPNLLIGFALFLVTYSSLWSLLRPLLGVITSALSDIILSPPNFDPSNIGAYRAWREKVQLIETAVLGLSGFGVTAAYLIAASYLLALARNLAFALGYRRLRTVSFEREPDTSSQPSGDVAPDYRSESDDASLSEEGATPKKFGPLSGMEIARRRLTSHILSLRNASILNLFSGICIAVAGIWVLSTVFVDVEKFGLVSDKKISATDFVVFSLLPRISATLFIQIFAYFFLLMYRSNLADIRYFQNEISNLDAISSAIALSLNNEISATQKAVVTSLLKFERNRVMSKNQRVLNPADDAEVHGKLLSNLNQLIKTLQEVKSK